MTTDCQGLIFGHEVLLGDYKAKTRPIRPLHIVLLLLPGIERESPFPRCAIEREDMARFFRDSMSSLSAMEKRALEKFLQMGGGYILDFSNRTFPEFVFDSTGLDIDD